MAIALNLPPKLIRLCLANYLNLLALNLYPVASIDQHSEFMNIRLGLGNISILSPPSNIRACNINIANTFSHFNNIAAAIYCRIMPYVTHHYTVV